MELVFECGVNWTEKLENLVPKQVLFPNNSSKAQHNIDIIRPIREDHSWQAKAGKEFDINSFQIDWKQQCATLSVSFSLW